MNTSQIFKAAHTLTRKTIRQGDSYQVTFAAALRLIYQERKMADITLDTLTAVGGKEWKRDDKHRVYFNDLASLFGLKTSHYNTGNISSASLDGQPISNGRAREIAGALSGSKVWYDLGDQQFHYNMYRCREYDGAVMGNAIVTEIKNRISAL